MTWTRPLPRAPRRVRVLVVSLLALALGWGGTRALAAEAVEWAGRPLAEALDRLRDEGLRLVYGSNVVRPSMRVSAEPVARSPRAILDEILAPHALVAQETSSGILRVVPLPRGAVSGGVRHAESGAPLPGVEIEIAGVGSTRTSDSGAFELAEVPAGTHVLEARKAGFVIERIPLEVEAGARLSLEIALQPVERTLEEIVVTPGRVSLFRDSPGSGTEWTREEVGRLPHLSDDLFRAVSRISGLAAGDFSADFHIRGGEASEVLVLIDGLRVYEPFHLRDIQNTFSIFDTRVTGSVDVSSGGFTAEHGDRMSGVLEISSLVPTDRTTLVGVTFEKAHLASHGRLPSVQGDWLVSARRGYLDVLVDLAQTAEDDFHLRPSYFDVFARLRRPLGTRHLLTFSLLGAGDRMTFESDSDRDDLESSYGNAYAWARMDSSLGASLSLTTLLAIGRLDGERVGESGSNHSDPFTPNQPDRDLTRVFDRRETHLVRLRQDWSRDAGSRHLMRWGYEVERLEADYDYRFTSVITDPVFTDDQIILTRLLDRSPSGEAYSAYLTDRVRLSERLTLEAGLRWDRQTYIGDAQTTPRLNLAARLSTSTTLRASWGRYAQSQGIHELQIADGVGTYHPAQINTQTTLALDHRLSDSRRLALQVYSKRIASPRPRFENLFESIDVFPEGQSDRVRVEPDRARASGVELLFEHRGRELDLWAAYTLSKAEDEIDGEWVPRSWDQRHALSFSVNWSLGERWNFNLAGIHHSGWPATDVEIVATPEGGLRLAPGERNRSRYPDYHRIDLRASRRLPVRRGQLEVYLEVTNLLDRRNIRSISDFELIAGPSGEPTIDREYETWLPRLPSFGLAWTF